MRDNEYPSIEEVVQELAEKNIGPLETKKLLASLSRQGSMKSKILAHAV